MSDLYHPYSSEESSSSLFDLTSNRVRGKPHAWDPIACLASARSLLSFIHQTLSSHLVSHPDTETPHPVFRISFSPKPGPIGEPAGVSIHVIGKAEFERDVLGGKKEEERVGFLLKRWVDGVKQRRERIRQKAGTPYVYHISALWRHFYLTPDCFERIAVDVLLIQLPFQNRLKLSKILQSKNQRPIFLRRYSIT